MLPIPINFTAWLEENREKLQPPINNTVLYHGKDTIVMVVGGPNKRSDYHINETEVQYNPLLSTMSYSSPVYSFLAINCPP